MAFTTVLACLSFLLLLLLLLLPLLTRARKKDKSAPKLPPGPARLPIIGNFHQLGKIPHHSLFELSKKHGPLMYLQLGIIPTIVASSADTAKQVMKTHDLDCCSRPLLTSTSKLSYDCSDVAFAPYGERWRELRKISIVELFSPKKVLSFQYIREEEVERMISSISSWSSINLSELLLSLANNITCRAAFGKRYYGEGTDDGSRLHKILEEAQAMVGGFFFADYIPMLGWLDVLTGMRSRLEKIFNDLDGFYQQVIDEHMDPMRKKHDRGEDTMDALLSIQKDAPHLTNDHIKGVLMNIFIAGTDTSSAAVDWAMAELMRNPRVMKKAQDEVRSLIGRKGKVEECDLPQLHYLKCVMKEVMRLHPPAPLLVQRETMQHCRISGYDVPPKTRLLVNAWAIGREKESWEMPEEFYPERFVNSLIDLKGHDFQLIPFGAGRRICPGMHAGILVAELALASLLYSFDWELPVGMSKEDIDMDEASGITVHRKSALCLVATKYSGIKDSGVYISTSKMLSN